MTPTKVMEPLRWALPPAPVRTAVATRLPEPPAGRPPLLFVHGLSHGGWCWEQHWMDAAAARGWPCYALDLRGHGRSDGADRVRRWKFRDYEHDILQAVVDLPERPVLIGHSMGALLVRRVLALYPARAAVLVAPAGASHGLEVVARLMRNNPSNALRALALQPVKLNRRDLFIELSATEAAQYEQRLTPESPLAQMEVMLSPRPTRTYAPVLVVGGGDDRLVPVLDVVRTARAYGAQAHIFRGMGHDLMLEPRWREPLDLMLDWLDKTTGVQGEPDAVGDRDVSSST